MTGQFKPGDRVRVGVSGLPARLQCALNLRGMNMKQLSVEANLNETAVRDIIQRNRSPGVAAIEKLADVLGCDAGWLAFGPIQSSAPALEPAPDAATVSKMEIVGPAPDAASGEDLPSFAGLDPVRTAIINRIRFVRREREQWDWAGPEVLPVYEDHLADGILHAIHPPMARLLAEAHAARAAAEARALAAEQAVETEREACAKVAETGDRGTPDGWSNACRAIAHQIRTRVAGLENAEGETAEAKVIARANEISRDVERMRTRIRSGARRVISEGGAA
jgi:transcriptional regulator with XRE-family HTH domain